ncbi:hypothetical protein [Hymenobacter sp. PAMC 26628]|uniref:hypothetical protein n=1 Tax=Hymenobacter sp. PAMC 26628 TaxID=1484118 RepID=UPI0007705EA9|nr:hypothetical protein [Hymenobacter sp. PAMC 26628]AMJ66539.1 hypothetical protein AXW84_14695 [Hymenobacter sp. PAMC 26628]
MWAASWPSAPSRCWAWLLVLLALAGSGMFFYASVLLIWEWRVMLRDVGSETDYLVQHNPLA